MRSGRPWTIALVYGSYLHVGGVESHILSLLRHSDPSRYRWIVMAAASPEFAGQARALAAEVVAWHPGHQLDAAALVRLLRLLRRCRVDLVHVHSPRAAILACPAAAVLRLPAVVTVHLPAYHLSRGRDARARLSRWLYQQAEKFWNRYLTQRLIHVSRRVYEEQLALHLLAPARAVVIQNGVELEGSAAGPSRSTVRAALGTPGDTRVIVSVGRLDVQKGLDTLLTALGRLRPARSSVWLVGDGPERAGLEAQARALGISEWVRFLGFRSDVPALLQASDLFVLPSRYETTPIAILEAMAAGLPSIVTDVGDNRYLVEDGASGLVVPPDDVSDLAAAIETLLSDPERRQRMGAAARERVAAYSIERTVQRVQDVYASLLGPPRAGGAPPRRQS